VRFNRDGRQVLCKVFVAATGDGAVRYLAALAPHAPDLGSALRRLARRLGLAGALQRDGPMMVLPWKSGGLEGWDVELDLCAPSPGAPPGWRFLGLKGADAVLVIAEATGAGGEMVALAQTKAAAEELGYRWTDFPRSALCLGGTTAAGLDGISSVVGDLGTGAGVVEALRPLEEALLATARAHLLH
jgi:hypothetical protein